MDQAAARAAPRFGAWPALVTGTAVASMSSILTRYATEASPLVVSFYRCAAAGIILLPFGLARLRSMSRPLWSAPVVGGLLLAVHFASWITSLYLTTVAVAVLLVSTGPIFVAVAARLLWGDRLPALGWGGIALALLGTALIAGFDSGRSSGWGHLLALVGAASGGGYAMAGQVARRTLGGVPYSALAYGVAALVLGPVALVAGSSFGNFEAPTWWAIAGLVVGPQLIGHTLINSSLNQLHATTVNTTIMAEPVIATALAAVLFSEVPSAIVVPGGLAILAGIGLVTKGGVQTEVVPE